MAYRRRYRPESFSRRIQDTSQSVQTFDLLNTVAEGIARTNQSIGRRFDDPADALFTEAFEAPRQLIEIAIRRGDLDAAKELSQQFGHIDTKVIFDSLPEEIRTQAQQDYVNRKFAEEKGGFLGLVESGADKIAAPVESTITGALDLLQRGNYAVAGYSKELVEGAKEGNPFSGIDNLGALARGLAGKDKTTFADVIDTAIQDTKLEGIPRPIVEGVGLGLDIFADPVTYVGIGLIGKGAKVADVMSDIQTAKRTVKGVRGADDILNEIATHLPDDILKRASLMGDKVDPDVLKMLVAKELTDKTSDANRILRASQMARLDDTLPIAEKYRQTENLFNAEVNSVIDDLSGALFRETTRSPSLKIQTPFGRKVFYERPLLSKDASNKIVQKAADFSQTRIGKAFGGTRRAFSTRAQSGELGQAFRLISEANAADHATVYKFFMEGGTDSKGVAHKGLKNIFDELGADVADRESVMFALDNIKHLQEMDERLIPAYDALHTFYKTMDEKEVALGFRPRGSSLADYAPRYTRGSLPKTIREELIWPKIPPNSEVRPGLTLKELSQTQGIGEHIITDPIQAAALRMRDHFEKLSHYEFGRVLKDISIEAPSKTRVFAATAGGGDVAQALPQGSAIRPFKEGNFKTFREVTGMGRKRFRSIYGDSVDPDTWITPELQDTVKRMHDLMTNADKAGEVANLYDRALRQVKFWQTVPNPGHHFRNTFGDVLNNYMDGLGVRDFRRYSQANHILRKQFDEATNLGDVFITMKGQQYNAGELLDKFTKSGGRTSFSQFDLLSTQTLTGTSSPYKKFTERLAHIANVREDTVRFAHFLDVVAKRGELSDDVVREAVGRVRMFNFDYADLTKFEQDVMKRVIPFYTWMKKNLVLQAELALTRPGAQATLAKVIRAQNDIFGTGDAVPFLPHWIAEVLPIDFGGSGGFMRDNRSVPLVAAIESGGPFLEAGKALLEGNLGAPAIFYDEAAGVLSPMATPPLQYFMERGAGVDLFTGAEVPDPTAGQPVDWLTDLVPALKITKQLGSNIPGSQSAPLINTFFDQRDVGDDTASVINYLFGADIRHVSAADQLSEFRRRQDAIEGALSSLRSGQKIGEDLLNLLNEEQRAARRNMQAQQIISSLLGASR